jgi:diguanylate cyclase (GGDEF)-like protein
MGQRPTVASVEMGAQDLAASAVLLEATRALLWTKTPAEARTLANDVVVALGGTVVLARAAGPEALPVDLSFGDGDPVLPSAPAGSGARRLLQQYLASFVADVGRALELSAHVDRLVEDATIDSLTLLPNRRMIGRALGRLKLGDVLIMVDLDNFKQVNDTFGHVAGDAALTAFARTIRATLRGRDFAGRYGGDEFVLVLGNGSDPAAFLERFRRAWQAVRPFALTFSAGIAVAGVDVATALPAADGAVYRAKQAGRDRWSDADRTASR